MRGSRECSAETKIASCIDFVDATVIAIKQQQYQPQHSRPLAKVAECEAKTIRNPFKKWTFARGLV